jgi:hypothetical protein
MNHPLLIWRERNKMKKGLLKKVAVGGLGLATAFIMGSCERTYNINGDKVKTGWFHTITKYDERGEIVYAPGRGIYGEDMHIFVNGKLYTPKDTLVYPEYKKEYDYLKEKIDSTKEARKKENMGKDDLWVVTK